MGCDIHAFIEFQPYAPQGELLWQTFACLQYEPRDYLLFSALTAGEVRGYAGHPVDGPPVRGIPPQIGWETADGFYIDGDPAKGQDPDNHTPSWVDQAELGRVLLWVAGRRSGERPPLYEPYWDAVSAAMRALDEAGTPGRLVFWFDN
jgi:hypothetical protein